MSALRQRQPRYENRALTALAKHVPCMFTFPHICSGDTVACHSNWLEWGKGVGKKCSDWAWASGCLEAHKTIDGRIQPTFSEDERRYYWLQAYISTQDYIWRERLVRVTA
jgi:hypothetical protein